VRVPPGRVLLYAIPGGLATLLGPGTAAAQPDASGGLRYDTRVDIPVLAGAAALVLGAEVFKGWLAPERCRLCDRHADGSDALNVVDAAVRADLRWDDTELANVASNVTGFALAPLASLGLCEVAAGVDGRSRDAPANALVVLEAVVLAGALGEAVKLAAGRQRPFAHFRDPSAAGPRDPDENLSFYSGHTTLDFSLAVASGTLASMRGYRLAPAVWASALPVAFLTGYLRIAADRHYFTDVLTGALLGSAVGFVVPFVFHRAPLPASGEPAVGVQAPLTWGGAQAPLTWGGAQAPLTWGGAQAPLSWRGPFLAGSWSF
jgi:membrane-associated phospholipid phosphatase